MKSTFKLFALVLAALFFSAQANAQCPTLSIPPGSSEVIRVCTGNNIDLTVDIDGAASPSDVIWNTGVSGTTINTGTVINDGTCDNLGSQLTFTATLQVGACPPSSVQYVVVIVADDLSNFGQFNPEPVVEVLDGGCTVALDACSSLDVQYSVNGGPLQDGRNYTHNAPPGITETGSVEFFITNPCGTINHGPLVGNYNCTGTFECPDIFGILPPESICSGESVNLEVILTGDASPNDIIWSNGSVGTTTGTGILTNTTNCDPITQNFMAIVTSPFSGDCDADTVQFEINVLPDPSVGAQLFEGADGCSVSVTTCPDFNVGYTVNGGAFQLGNSYTSDPEPGTSENAVVDFAISNSCGTYSALNGVIDCDGPQCPDLFIPASADNPILICSGESATLTVVVTGEATASDVIWSHGETGTTVSTGILTNTVSCDNREVLFTATIPANILDGCPAITRTYTVLVFPDPTTNAQVELLDDGCIATVTGTCPGVGIQHSVNGGPLQSGGTYGANPGPNETEVSDIEFVLANGCSTGTLPAQVNCEGVQCPTISLPPGGAEVIPICTGNTVELEVVIGGNANALDVVWSNGQTGTHITVGPFPNNGTCDNPGSQFPYSATIQGEDGCPDETIYFLVVAVADELGDINPDPFYTDPTVIVNGCTVHLDACSILEVQYSVNGGPLQDGDTYVADPPFGVTEAGTVEFFLTNPCGIVTHQPLIGNYSCTGTIECPTLTPISDVEHTICSGESVQLEVEVGGDATPANITWSNGAIGSIVNTGTLANLVNCDPEAFVFTATVPAMFDCPAQTVNFTINVLPDPASGLLTQATTSPDGCMVSLSTCPQFGVEYSVNGSSLQSGNAYTADPAVNTTEVSIVNFLVTSTCGVFTGATGSTNCVGFQCPDLTPASSTNLTVCSGNDATLSVSLTGNGSPSEILWSNGAIGTSINTGTLTNLNSCDAITQTFTATLTSSNPECPVESVSFTVNILPDPASGALTQVINAPDGCSVVLQTCSGFNVTHSVNGGAPQAGNTYISNPAPGTTEVASVAFTLSNTCGSFSGFVGNVNCQGPECPVLSPITPVSVSVCSGQSADLSVGLSGDASESNIVWNTGAIGTSINTGVLANLTSCDPLQFTYTASIAAGTVGGCPATSVDFIVTVLPDPTSAFITEAQLSPDGCTVSLNTCPGFGVQYSVNGGGLITGNSYTANPAAGTIENSNVSFVLTSSCGTVNGPSLTTNCQGPECPSLTPLGNLNQTICSGQIVDLDVLLSGDALASDVFWSNGSVGTSISTGVLTNTSSCDPAQFAFTASVSGNGSCPPVSVTYNISVLPDPASATLSQAQLSPDGCTVSLNTCPGFGVQYSVNGGGLISGSSYTANPAPGTTENSNVSFVISSSCGTANGPSLTTNCQGEACPVLSPVGGTSQTVCSGQSVDLSVLLSGDALASDIVWSTGSIGTSVNTGILTNTSSCDATTFTFTASILGNGACPATGVSYTISVLPDPASATLSQAQLSPDGCTVSLNTCPGFGVQYSVNGGGLISGSSYTANPAPGTTENSNVSFVISSSCGTANGPSLTTNCVGEQCPALSPVSGTDATVCSGSSIDLTVGFTGSISPSDIVWSNGATGASINTGNLLNNSSCDALTANYTATVAGVVPGCPPSSVMFTVSVLAAPSASLAIVQEAADGCSVTLVTCPDFQTQFSVNDGPLQDGDTYVASPGFTEVEVSEVDFVISNGCGSFGPLTGDILCLGGGVTQGDIEIVELCSPGDVSGTYQIEAYIIGGVPPYLVTYQALDGSASNTITVDPSATGINSFVFTVTNDFGYTISIVDFLGDDLFFDQSTFIGCLGPVDVELLSFEGTVLEEGNLLKWVTATETNNDFLRFITRWMAIILRYSGKLTVRGAVLKSTLTIMYMWMRLPARVTIICPKRILMAR